MNDNLGSPRTRLLIVTQWFDPEPAYRGLSFAKSLEEQNYEVDVVTGIPNYPGGKIYSGYKVQPMKTEEMDGIRVTRLPLFPSHDTSKIGRILNYFSFMASVFFYLLFRTRATDVIYVYHPPLTVGLAVALSQLIRRKPFILEIQDMWPDTLSATGMIGNEKVLKVINAACNWLYRRATKVIVQSDGFRTLLLNRGVPTNKVDTILGWADEEALLNTPKVTPIELHQYEGTRVVFAGTMGKAQALETVILAAEKVAKLRTNVTFFFIGGGIEKDSLIELAKTKGIQNVVFLPKVPMTEIGSYLSNADVLLVHLKDDPLFHITIPSKTLAYLAVGRPIIMGVQGDSAKIIRDANAGFVIQPEDSNALADAIEKIDKMEVAERMKLGENAYNFYASNLSQSIGINKFAEVINDVAASLETRE